MSDSRFPIGFAWLRRLFTRTPAARPRRSGRLVIEILEDRTLLTGLLVQTMPGYAPTTMTSWLADQGATVQATRIAGLFKIDAPDAQIASLTSTLRANGNVAYVEKPTTYTIQAVPNDPKFTDGTLYGLNGAFGIKAPAAWDVTTGSSAVTVAVIDTGVDYTHPDLYQNIWINQGEIPPAVKSLLQDVDGDGLITFRDLNNPVNQGPFKITDQDGDGRITAADILKPYNGSTGMGGWADGIDNDFAAHVVKYTDDLVGWNFVNNTNNPFDDNSHGTHTSGTIGAVGNNGVGVVGVNWNVQIMGLKFLDSAGSGSDTDAATAIDYAADRGAQLSSNSWGGGGFSSTLFNAINYAAGKNNLFVAAAGNAGQNTDINPFYPSDYNLPNIISVAATDSSGALAGFSNYGPTSVDLGAPGVNIYSTVPGGYGFKSGTSMATPHVAGAAALILSQFPGLSYAALKDRILSTVTPLPSLAGNTVTGGLLNVFAALAAPKIHVFDGATDLTNGASTVSFGSTFVGTPISKTFTVKNLGNQTLNLTTPITVPAGYTVTSSFGATTVAAGASTTFTIRLAAAAAGTFTGPLSFGNNDTNQNPFNFTLTGTVTAVPVTFPKFDFGTATSPVASGYTQVTESTLYTAARGYGWQSATGLLSFDRGTGTDLTRDFIYGPDATFLDDISNGTYDITLTLGDSGAFVHDQVGVYAEGTQLDTVTTAAGQIVTKTYTVTVADGQLTLRLRDLGGSDPYFVIEGLQIAASAPDTAGPTVSASTPTGNLSGSVDRITFTFNEAIKDGTFTLSDVVSLTGPGGSLTPLAVNKLNNTQYEVTFAAQTALGSYSMTIGPDITDVAGNPMNQNGNGTNGENPGDRYTASFTLITPPAFPPQKYDFGTASSPVASGYTQVTEATLYTVAQGYGWQSTAGLLSFDRGTGTDLTRDFNYGADGTYLADVPNGTYDITLTLGDTGAFVHDQVGVFAEGTQLDTVTTAAGQIVTNTYTVTVADGQLTLRLHDLGGTDPNFVIQGLQIAASAPDTAGPTVSASTPTGNLSGSVDRITFTFNEAIKDGTFTLSDVVSLSGPSGSLTPLAVNKLSNTQYEVTFAAQTALGSYSMTIGPDITDVAGNPMNQNGNGTNGETPGDRYTASFTLITPLGFQAKFDFGTASSPVASGYTQVTEATVYTMARGYGWQSTTGLLSFDRGTGTDLTRDFNYGADGTFLADVPNGTYNITLTLGDTGSFAHDQVGIFAEGAQLDTVTTAAGQVVTKTYTVTVADGQLTLRLRDLGGADPYFVIEGLVIAQV